jgi:AcrR family transcriptional regulator
MNVDQDKASSRDRILEAAVDLFAAHGFEATTMRMLGEAVGLDNSSLYRHFAGKSELANAALDRVTELFLMAVGPRLAAGQPVTLDSLASLAAEAGLYFFDRPAAARLMMHWLMSLGSGGPAFGVSGLATDPDRPGGRLFVLLQARLAEGVRTGALRRCATPDGIVVLMGAVLLRPATRGHLLASLEPEQDPDEARRAWETELRAVVRGAFAP